jgi:hypothetical protein
MDDTRASRMKAKASTADLLRVQPYDVRPLVS